VFSPARSPVRPHVLLARRPSASHSRQSAPPASRPPLQGHAGPAAKKTGLSPTGLSQTRLSQTRFSQTRLSQTRLSQTRLS
jgi:hypothetical protein